MLTRAGAGLLGAAAALLATGLALGNYLLLSLALAPAFALLVPATLGQPRVSVRRRLDADAARVGTPVTCTLEVTVGGGPGIVEVHQDLPDPFVLEDGSNLHVLACGLGTRTETFSFRFRPTTRGDHVLPPADVEAADPTGLLAPTHQEGDEAVELPVAPPTEDLPRGRGLEAAARDLVPEGDPSQLGLRTTEFRDVRDYAWGDPPRSVNWKATAQRLAAAPPEAGALPLVNEYEREGRKAVWIFLDAGEHMRVGTDLDNALDHAVRGAVSLAHFFLDRGYTVGGAAYRARGNPVISPGNGPEQIAKVHETFRQARPGDDDGGLAGAVERSRVHLAAEDPLVVVLTRAGADPDDAERGLRRLRRIEGRVRDLPALVVSPRTGALLPGPDDEPARAAEAAGAALERDAVRRLRDQGANVLPWDPREHPLDELLRQGVPA